MKDEIASEIKSLHKSGLSCYKISQKLNIHPYHIRKTLFHKDIQKIYNKDCRIKSKKQILLEWIEKHYFKSDCKYTTVNTIFRDYEYYAINVLFGDPTTKGVMKNIFIELGYKTKKVRECSLLYVNAEKR